MTAESKRRFRRDFMPHGALRRGTAWLSLCWVVAYALPPVAQALTNS